VLPELAGLAGFRPGLRPQTPELSTTQVQEEDTPFVNIKPVKEVSRVIPRFPKSGTEC
jgi:hypothetical protein